MAEVKISGLIEGGKATAGPPFGPALGPLGVNIGAIIAEINKQTSAYAGIKVPITVIVDNVTKDYRIEVGSPPTSAIILKELKLTSGAKTKDETVGDITIAQLKKIAKSKDAVLYGKSEKEKLKQVIGTCKSMGVKVEGQDPREVIKKIDSGEIKV
ncbi:50S ribosomal protein L11p [Candidatus Mancarchaeum acidiphilum]|uniref:Large ribosomal subunit protein uL11 n=1 Tax=Candidatus Mancarchaeum acidiphilum TaxID=1920749 RepID=A0A218NMK0_9ARCH|nr:50S ribosomal protein L11 [Candidatus Mancarchaeum acidiphilum]ASI13694.1 50S ribosomal protein L11p [Candidatus Mancarchaeum acidiphilum]